MLLVGFMFTSRASTKGVDSRMQTKPAEVVSASLKQQHQSVLTELTAVSDLFGKELLIEAHAADKDIAPLICWQRESGQPPNKQLAETEGHSHLIGSV